MLCCLHCVRSSAVETLDDFDDVQNGIELKSRKDHSDGGATRLSQSLNSRRSSSRSNARQSRVAPITETSFIGNSQSKADNASQRHMAKMSEPPIKSPPVASKAVRDPHSAHIQSVRVATGDRRASRLAAALSTAYDALSECRAAAMCGDKERLKSLLDNDASGRLLYTTDAFGRTLLMQAVLCDRPQVVRYLLRVGAPYALAHTADRFGRSPMHVAVMKDSIECLKELLTHETRQVTAVNPSSAFATRSASTSALAVAAAGANCIANILESRDAAGASILHLAARLPNTRCLKLIVRSLRSSPPPHGVLSSSLCDSAGRSPLHYAAAAGRAASVHALLAQRALQLNVDQADHWGRTPVMMAAACLDPHRGAQCISVILQHAAWSSCLRDKRGLSAMHFAAAAASLPALTALLHKALPPPSQHNDTAGRVSVLSLSAREVTRRQPSPQLGGAPHAPPSGNNLFADTGYHTDKSSSPLDRSHVSGGQSTVDPVDNDFRTPLHWAARVAADHVVNELLNRGADPMHKDRHGATPMHYAARHDHSRCLGAMLAVAPANDAASRGGGTAAMKDGKGRSPFAWAVAYDAKECVAAMLTHWPQLVDRDEVDADGNTALHIASSAGHVALCSMLIAHGWDVDCVRSPDGRTALMLASAGGHSRCVRLLLDSGARRQARDTAGCTPLHWCSLAGHTYVCQMLTDHAAHTPADSDALSMQHSTASGNGRAQSAGTDALVHGAASELRALEPHAYLDNHGRSPVHCAAFAGHQGCLTTLYQAGFSPFVADHERLLPMHLAAGRGHVDCVHLLLEYGTGANVIAATGDNAAATPWDLAPLAPQHAAAVRQVLSDYGGAPYRLVAHTAAVIIQAAARGHSVRRRLRNATASSAAATSVSRL